VQGQGRGRGAARRGVGAQGRPAGGEGRGVRGSRGVLPCSAHGGALHERWGGDGEGADERRGDAASRVVQAPGGVLREVRPDVAQVPLRRVRGREVPGRVAGDRSLGFRALGHHQGRRSGPSVQRLALPAAGRRGADGGARGQALPRGRAPCSRAHPEG